MSANDFQINPNQKATNMPTEWVKLAYEVFKVPTTSHNEVSMALYLCDILEEMNINYSIDNYGNILITKGITNLYPCFCAHLDTVHMYKNGFQVVSGSSKGESRLYLYALDNQKKKVGIGGDDKCGIFACLYLLTKIENIKIVFFSSEESGGIGSSNVDTSFFVDCKFVGGIDRWNGNDFINKYSGQYTISTDFKRDILPLMEKYGYTFNSGLFTDVFNVMERHIDISCFNMSCGYYSHHSDSEYVDLSELWNCCLFAEEICSLQEQYFYERKVVPITYNYGWSDCWDSKEGRWGKRNLHWDDKYNLWRYSERDYDASDIHRDLKSKAPEHKKCAWCQLELLPGEKTFCSPCRREYDKYKDDMDLLATWD